MGNPPPDQTARDRISRELDRGHFVQAGAGSGKTTQIITRIISLVREGIPLSGIAAITFTEKAAADLRRRLRDKLEEVQREAGQTPEGALFSAALDSLDAAPIGTIHSFARRLLTENPIEARVPPGFEVRSDLATSIDRQTLWQSQRQALFRDPALRPHVEPLLKLGVTESAFEELSAKFDEYWDRLENYRPGVVDRGSLQKLRALVDDLVAFSAQCLKPEKDSLVARITEMVEILAKLDETDPTDIFARRTLLYRIPNVHGRTGAKTNWPPGVLDEGREMGAEAKNLAADAFLDMIQEPMVQVLAYFRQMSIDRATRRRLDGTLNFQDLLVLARNLLRSGEQTWSALSQRYPRIIVDEFQDTDPLQADIVCRLAAVSFEPDTHWSKLELRPGALVTVGDPKQSIYRFRGADIDTYFTHRDRSPGQSGQETIELTTNFRSTQPVLDWVNAAFDTLIQENGRIQPRFVPLDTAPIQDQLGPLLGASVTVIGSGTPAKKAAESRAEEAQDIAHAVLQAIGCLPGVPGWTKQVREDGGVRIEPVTLSDICILIPSRTSLPPLEAALRQAEIEFISEASSVVYSTVEVQALLFAARAIANPADQASLVLALRSPLFGIGDDELLQWKASGGKWSVFHDMVSAESPMAVGRALHTLQRLVFTLPALSPSDVLETLVNECLFYEKALFAGAGRRAWWRRVRYVVDQAEAWYQTTKGSLRDYLAWATIQQDENTRVTEAVSPEIGDDALHIMTVHMAKGLEFPVVMLAGGMSGPKSDRPTVFWDDSGQPHVILAKNDKETFPVSTPNYAEAFQREKEAGEEEYRRLYYVACTRAESHLVVSRHCYKPIPKVAFTSFLKLAEEAGVPEMGELEGDRSTATSPGPSAAAEPSPTVNPTAWESWHEGIVTRAATPRTMSVTALAHDGKSALARDFFSALGISPPLHGPIDGDTFDEVAAAAAESEEPEPTPKRGVRFVDKDVLEGQKAGKAEVGEGPDAEPNVRVGAGGPAFGNALHWVMEVSDLTPGDHIPRLVERAAHQFGVDDREALAHAVGLALENDVIIRARRQRHWLELSLALAQKDLVVEGFADLVFEDSDGSLVVVDFKTDRVLEEATLEAYWAQLSSYAVILGQVTGKTAERCVIVHCPAGAESARTIEQTVRFQSRIT